MERKENRLPIFTERFRSLQEDRTNTEFADFLSLSRQTVGFYCNGDRLPDVITLKQIARKCNVTTDWLLGESDIASVNTDTQTAGFVTGLSDAAIGVLQHNKRLLEESDGDSIPFGAFLSGLICSDTFYNFVIQLIKCKENAEAATLLMHSVGTQASLSDLFKAADKIYNDENLARGIRDEALIYRELFANDTMLSGLLSDDPDFGAFDQCQLYEYRASRLLTKLMDELRESAGSHDGVSSN